jgi:glycosyltransferase involved in cell wall biosynthesis
MNILILHGSSDLYGASKILLVTVCLMKKKGHTPIVVLTEDGPLVKELQDDGIEVVFIRLGILRRKYKSLSGLLNRLLVLRKAFYAIKKLIRDKQVSLVYSNTTAVLAGAFAARSLKVKHIWHVHEIIESPGWLYRFLGNLLNKYSDIVIVVSHAVQKSWGRFVSEEKLCLIYNGIDYSPYQLPSKKLRTELGVSDDIVIIGMVGRVHFWKGQDYFLQIAAELSKRVYNIRFVMIGDVFPGYEYLYENLTLIQKQAQIESIVTDLGYRSDVSELMQGFDIFVLPSTAPDPFPTVILEAMASAKPVVATNQGGALEMVDENITGLFIELNNPEKASLQVEKLVKNRELRIQMGKAGRQKVLAAFSKEAFENKLIKVLE